MSSIEVRPVAGALGAEIHGVDLSQPIDDASFKDIHEALLQRQVIFFRDQDITPDQQKDFGRRFGELHVHPFIPSLQGHPEIIVLQFDEKLRPVTDRWHTDVTFDATPPLGSILYAQELPEYGGDTLWANMYMAFETLSKPLQDFLCTLTAVHDFTHNFGQAILLAPDGPEKLKAAREANPPVEHPVVRTHPETGRKALFVNSVFTAYIKGLAPEESEHLLGFLYRHTQSPNFQCRFRWQKGSLAMWDNRCTQHYALADYTERRRMHRVTIIGDRPY